MNKRLGTFTILLAMLLVVETAFAQYAGGSYDGYAVGSSGSDISLPVELISFTASVERSSTVTLEWVTESEIENLGFILERRDSKFEIGNWEEIASYITNSELQGQGSVTYRTEYSYTDNTVEIGQTYDYRLADVSYAGVKEYHSMSVLGVTVTIVVPEEYVLHPAYPNPFNPKTTISFDLPMESYVMMVVYDMAGREITTLVNGLEQAGRSSVTWNGKDNLGQPVSTGTYLYRISTNGFNDTRKVLLLK